MDVVFLVPTICRDSVSFVAMQYANALRAEGIEAGIAGVRGGDHPAIRHLKVGQSALASCGAIISNLFLPDLAAAAVKRARPRVRWISLLHCDLLTGILGERKSHARQRIGLWRQALAGADAIAAPSFYSARALMPGGPPVVRLPHALLIDEETRFRGVAGVPPAAHPADARPTFVFIGRDTPTKRLYAMFRLLKANPDAHIRLISRLDHSAGLYAALSGADRARVELIGFAPDPYAHVGRQDIIVCASGREGFGLIPVEAIARGLRPATIREGAFEEYWNVPGLCYDRVEDVPMLAPPEPAVIAGLRARFVGAEAMTSRIDVLKDLLAGRTPAGKWFL